MSKDTLKANLARWVQIQIGHGEIEGATISGLSAPPGCGEYEVKDALIKTSVLDNNTTAIFIKTPAGPRHFEVHFKETY